MALSALPIVEALGLEQMMNRKQRDIIAVFCLVYGILFWLPVTGDKAFAGQYSLSAHGDATYGVERESLFGTYVQGNCAHCHEQHASIGGEEPAPVSGAPAISALFHNTFNTSSSAPYVVSDLFCFYCHSDITGESIQYNAGNNMKNYDYSYTFGGCSTTFGGRLVDDILETFNWPSYSSTGSNHNLRGLQVYADANFSSWFGTNSDPCTTCHNPHIARRNKENLHDSTYSTISLPSDHNEHWGDESDEQMSDYSSTYHAPYYWNSTTLYEPDGTTHSGGDLIPDYNTFCLDCHGTSAGTVYSRNHSRNLSDIDWGGSGGDNASAGDKHGTNVATGDIDTKPPYNNTFDIVTACTDCHEPHGSPYDYLMRRSINGYLVGAIGVSMGDRGNQCLQCHMDDEALGFGNTSNKWKLTHHGGGQVTDSPYRTNQMQGCGCHSSGSGQNAAKIPCDDCHYHHSYVSDTQDTPVYTDPSDGIPTHYVPPPADGVGRKTF